MSKANYIYKIIRLILQILVIFMMVGTVVLAKVNGIDYLQREYIINNTVDVMGLVVMFILMSAAGKNLELFGGVLGPEGWFFGMLFITALGLFCDFAAWTVQGIARYAFINRLTNFGFFLCAPALMYVFWIYIITFIGGPLTRKKHILWAIESTALVLSVIILILNWRFGIYFTVNSEGVYQRAEGTFFISIFFNVLMMMLSVIEVLTSNLKRQEKIALTLFGMTPFASYIVQTIVFGLSVTFAIIAIALVMVYIDAQSNRARQLADLRVKMVQSQLQPHFIFNGMMSIRMLIKKDPETAANTMDHFMGYLRGTIDAYNSEDMVTIEAELKVIKDYLEIEQVRFGKNIEYEINNESEGFLVPPLSIQPLVENAIKHGIRQRMDGCGKVIIHVRDEEMRHVITVEDNGVGFNTKEKRVDDGHIHIGVDSAERRFEYYLGGKMNVESVEGEGTKVEIVVPKKR